MKNYLIAWRNLWRNRRRTAITVASVFFAVFFALVMRAWQLGTYDHMFRNVIESYTGYIQIQHPEFWDNKTVDNAFPYTEELDSLVKQTRNSRGAVPRLESFALASSGNITKGVLVMGIDPERESLLSDVKSRLVRYRLDANALERLMKSDLPEKIKKNLTFFSDNAYSSNSALAVDFGISDKDSAFVNGIFRKEAGFRNGYIKSGEPGALIGDKLSKFLNASVGDTVVLIGQGYHGATAAGKYRISGIVKIPAPEIDNKIVYLPVDICQQLYDAPGMLTSLAVGVVRNDEGSVDETVNTLRATLPGQLRVMDWKEMNKLLINQMDADSKSGMIMIVILYLVIAFGIFGTVLMMTAERRREFGVLVAIGMQKAKLASVITLEIIYMGFLGIVSGTAFSLPVIFIGHYNPIRFHGEMAKMYEDYGMEAVMPFMLPDMYMVWQSVVVSVILLIALIYPLRKIAKMQVVNSLKAYTSGQ
jgi:ABC-type lipoprotein release transport system permease subunit